MYQKPTYEELKKRVRELEKVEVECKKSEEILQKKMQRFRDLAETTSDWIWETDLKGMYTYSNHKVTEFLGYEPEELIGKTPFDLMPIDESERVSDLFNTFLSSQSSFESMENVNIHKNGSHVVLETSGVPIFDNEGGLLGYRGIDRNITHRKNVEEDLRNSEAKHKALVKNIPGMVYRASPDWSAEIISGSADISGFTEKEMNTKEKNWLSIIHHDDIEKVFEEGSKLSQVQKNLVQRYRIITKEGDIRWVEDSKASIFSEKGDFIGIDGIVFDITKRKRAEEALKEGEKKYRNLYNNAQVGLARTSIRTGKVLTCNDKMAQIFNYENTDDFINEYVFSENYVDPKVRELMLNKMKTYELLNNVEAEYYGKDKSKVWVRFDTRFFPDKGYMEDVVVDITESRIGEEALRESENRFRDISLSMADWIWETNKDTKLTYISQSIKDVLGYSPEELIGKTPFDLMPEDESLRIKEIVSKLISKSENIKDLENWNVHKEGRKLFMLTNAIPIIDNKGNVKGYRGINKNITSQRKLEAQLQQAQKMESIGTLAGGIAHDLNNILFPIVGYSEMLLEDISEESPFRDSLKKIYNSSLRAKDLVNQILTFSRQETNELKSIKVQSIIKDALKLMRSTIPTTIKIKSYIKADCCEIKADPTQIHQIVMNLTTNAYHAMEENGGELKVNFKEIEFGEQDLTDLELKPGIYNCLIVADTGVGMDKDLTDKIFDPFFTTKERSKGTGMGLSVVHGIVKNMDGAIHVYSEPGKGTEFHVYFPLAHAEKVQQETNAGMSIQGGTEHILLVDDEEEILTMGTKILERLGYQVTSFAHSIEALEAFSVNPDEFDLIITDMTMPNLSGDKLSTELIKIRSDIPILLCTGFSETISEKNAASLGIKGFLFKPIVMKELAQKIREVLDGNE